MRNDNRNDSMMGAGRLQRGRSLLAAVSVLLALLVAACSAAEDTGDTAAASPEPAPEAALSEPAVDASEPAAPAAADATVTGVDYGFEVGDVSPGDTVEFVNDSDVEAHEMVVMKVNDDSVTLEEIQELLEQDPEGPPPDFLEDAGFAFAMPNETAEQTVQLDAGRYLLLCFIPQNAPPDLVAQMMTSSEEPEIPSDVEAELGPPHAAAGMVDLIEVE